MLNIRDISVRYGITIYILILSKEIWSPIKYSKVYKCAKIKNIENSSWRGIEIFWEKDETSPQSLSNKTTHKISDEST